MPKPETLSDPWEPIRRARKGDPEAVGLVFERFYRAVHGIAYQKTKDLELAQDVTQEAFLKAFHYLHTLQHEEKFLQWMTAIIGHICSEAFRKKKNRPEPAGSPEEQDEKEAGGRKVMGSPEMGPRETLEQKETRQAVLEALDDLPDGLRIPLILRFVEGMRAAEIAEVLGSTTGSVRVTLHRATMALREKILRTKS